MYPEYDHLTHPPFAEEPNTEIFFPGARREEICQSLILDILAEKRLMKLTGREGSGKTLLWQVIAERLPSEYVVVFLDDPTGSFDELVRQICLCLGMVPRETEQDAGHIDVLYRLLAREKAGRNKVVLVVDEAEKLCHATLERLLSLVGDSREDLEWTTILIGRQEIDDRLDQISLLHIAIDVDAEYTLAELTENDTRQYLRFCLDAAEVRRGQFADVFTDEAVCGIFARARGNLRLTNTLARAMLREACAEKSFMVLLDEVEPEKQERKGLPFRWENRMLELYALLRRNKYFSGALIGAVAVVFAVGFLLTGMSGDEETPPAAVTADVVAVRTTTPVELRDGDTLFRERVAASANWLAGVQKGKYTIQLMLLESNQAQATVATTLAEDDFYRIREQLFIFRKRSKSSVVFVFHGLYDSLDAAREARNEMPVFLRRHHPYPLAVDDAMRKLSD